MKKTTTIRNQAINDKYNVLVNEGKSHKAAIELLAKDNDLGEHYVKNIIKHHSTSNSKDEKCERNASIVEMYMNGSDQPTIADKFGLTITRVGQIVRQELGKHAKNSTLEKSLEELKVDVASGMNHKSVQDKYGTSLLRKIKNNLGYNAFDACRDKRNKDILALYNNAANPMSAAEISEAYGLTRDHVYGILHEFGIRTKPTRTEYRKRNDAIVKAFKGGKNSEQLAENYGMTVTNINIILKNNGARD